MHEKVKLYISEAVEKGFPIEKIIDKLVSAGYKRSIVKKLAKEAIQSRIDELEGKEHRHVEPVDYIHEEQNDKHVAKIMAEIAFGVIIRMAIGLLMFVTLSTVILQQTYG